jgi:hypothetical protein
MGNQKVMSGTVIGYMVEGMPECQVVWITNSRLEHQKPAWKIGWALAGYSDQVATEFDTPEGALAHLQTVIERAAG